MKTVLFVGTTRDHPRAVERARELGLRVVQTHRTEVARELSADGVVAASSDAVSTVAALAEDRGLPGIGGETAHLLTQRVAMRRRLAEQGVAQPEFAAVRTLHEARLAVDMIGLPAVLEAADSAGRRGVFLLRYADELERHLHAALAESPTREAIVERYHEGRELDVLAVARDGHVTVLTVCDRFGPLQVYPTSLFGDALAEVEDTATRALHALALRDGVALTKLVALEDGIRVLDAAARLPDEETAQLTVHATGIDIVEIALLQAVGETVSDGLVTPRFQHPLAIQFLTAEPGPLPVGRVRRVGTLEKVRAFPGVVEARTDLAVGETIDPVRLNGERHGYVIATGDTNIEALDRAEAAARLVDVEVW